MHLFRKKIFFFFFLFFFLLRTSPVFCAKTHTLYNQLEAIGKENELPIFLKNDDELTEQQKNLKAMMQKIIWKKDFVLIQKKEWEALEKKRYHFLTRLHFLDKKQQKPTARVIAAIERKKKGGENAFLAPLQLASHHKNQSSIFSLVKKNNKDTLSKDDLKALNAYLSEHFSAYCIKNRSHVTFLQSANKDKAVKDSLELNFISAIKASAERDHISWEIDKDDQKKLNFFLEGFFFPETFHLVKKSLFEAIEFKSKKHKKSYEKKIEISEKKPLASLVGYYKKKGVKKEAHIQNDGMASLLDNFLGDFDKSKFTHWQQKVHNYARDNFIIFNCENEGDKALFDAWCQVKKKRKTLYDALENFVERTEFLKNGNDDAFLYQINWQIKTDKEEKLAIRRKAKLEQEIFGAIQTKMPKIINRKSLHASNISENNKELIDNVLEEIDRSFSDSIDHYLNLDVGMINNLKSLEFKELILIDEIAFRKKLKIMLSRLQEEEEKRIASAASRSPIAYLIKGFLPPSWEWAQHYPHFFFFSIIGLIALFSIKIFVWLTPPPVVDGEAERKFEKWMQENDVDDLEEDLRSFEKKG